MILKTIGLLGGMSWESSAEYYQIINETIAKRLGGNHSAKCLMYSFDFAEIEELQKAGNWKQATVSMIEAARSLEKGGADFLVICTNTMHKMADEVQQSIQIPLLHIVDAVAEQVIQQKHRRIGLLGTMFTMEEAFYKERLSNRYKLEVLIPEKSDRQIVHQIIYNELVSGKIIFSAEPDDVVDHLISVLEPPAELTQPSESVTDSASHFLERTLSEREIRLGSADGCRVTTAARAYPVVIEIIRKTKQAWEARDQAGVSLRELTDFKVHLTTPCLDKIPAFYKEESKSLEGYFQREFIDSNGTFGRVLHQTGQLDPVLAHVSGTIGKAQMAATTRRAILIIPHDNRLAEEVAPLGLVCVRVVPRITDAHLRFDFSFVWRTVEVLVGFPYSLYGSVRFSEHLTEQIRRRLEGREPPVEMGELSYIAQSLHMFTDEYGQIIARRIVNDASV